MWAALRSDLSEFVSGVADESSHVLTQIDASMEESECGEKTGEEGVETPKKQPKENEEEEEEVGTDALLESAKQEVVRLRGETDTYTEPLAEDDPEVQTFLDSFDIEQKTEEIASLLKEYPETLQVQFDELATAVSEEEGTNVVSYQQFWQRYFYRCDAERIARQWELEDEERRKARAEAISGSLSMVGDLFGGAVKAMSSMAISQESSPPPQSSPFQYDENAASTPGMSFFGASGRPPFVMNTAVDEDEDANAKGEPEEEEELGWDDDDDEGEEERELEEGESEEQITFTNDEVIKLQEQLNLAISERDQLRETVDMQKTTIGTLRAKEEASESAKEMEKLKMEVFEKDSELAALKASLEDTHDDQKDLSSRKYKAHIASLERDVEREKKAKTEAESQLVTAQQELEDSKAQLEQSRGEKEKAAMQVTELQAQIESLNSSLSLAKEECESLRGGVTNTDLQAQVAGMQSKLDAANERAEQLEKALVDAKKPQLTADVGRSPSDSTTSTGVKVSSTPTRVAAGGGENAEDDDGWGDDWDDEE
mmetsp:Transcript_31963/g.73456  ORF Transcript_31963/g.73456 Transcript_31963/m.73456 type:complete len:542 (-) Transcript_31963:555-2180(-)|eukprot:CAMPEP_0116845626 /NCGR_PEP_ID=MMETSP0418-20121206/13376_1 /TAXON_ID=1158023 /ORGANISM="Astrosyne radiata, Strain 13vi08-1A" /LENGTH=541 /DNA_ID=CAMNT_0004476767 /DNA_START=330 /DNA_END=1955 /DNA_ORIENTATION=+